MLSAAALCLWLLWVAWCLARHKGFSKGWHIFSSGRRLQLWWYQSINSQGMWKRSWKGFQTCTTFSTRFQLILKLIDLQLTSTIESRTLNPRSIFVPQFRPASQFHFLLMSIRRGYTEHTCLRTNEMDSIWKDGDMLLKQCILFRYWRISSNTYYRVNYQIEMEVVKINKLGFSVAFIIPSFLLSPFSCFLCHNHSPLPEMLSFPSYKSIIT